MLKKDFRVRKSEETWGSFHWNVRNTCNGISIFSWRLEADFCSSSSHEVFCVIPVSKITGPQVSMFHLVPTASQCEDFSLETLQFQTYSSYLLWPCQSLALVPKSQGNPNCSAVLQRGWVFRREGDSGLPSHSNSCKAFAPEWIRRQDLCMGSIQAMHL